MTYWLTGVLGKTYNLPTPPTAWVNPCVNCTPPTSLYYNYTTSFTDSFSYQGEFPKAPTRPCWDDRVQFGEPWGQRQQLKKDSFLRGPQEGGQRQPAIRRSTRVLPPGRHRQYQHIPVTTGASCPLVWAAGNAARVPRTAQTKRLRTSFLF